MLHKLNRWVDNPMVKLLVGVILFTTSLADLLKDLDEGFRAEHGVVVYGFFMILRTLPELQHGLENISSFKKRDE
jgi:hypothetical protein